MADFNELLKQLGLRKRGPMEQAMERIRGLNMPEVPGMTLNSMPDISGAMEGAGQAVRGMGQAAQGAVQGLGTTLGAAGQAVPGAVKSIPGAVQAVPGAVRGGILGATGAMGIEDPNVIQRMISMGLIDPNDPQLTEMMRGSAGLRNAMPAPEYP